MSHSVSGLYSEPGKNPKAAPFIPSMAVAGRDLPVEQIDAKETNIPEPKPYPTASAPAKPESKTEDAAPRSSSIKKPTKPSFADKFYLDPLSGKFVRKSTMNRIR